MFLLLRQFSFTWYRLISYVLICHLYLKTIFVAQKTTELKQNKNPNTVWALAVVQIVSVNTAILAQEQFLSS